MRYFKTKMLFVALTVLLVCTMCVNVCAGKFERNKTYSGHFKDVKTSAWYSASVKNAYEFGLMNGTATDKFNPKGMFTLAEAVTIAARMHSIYNGQGGVIPSAKGDWYMGAVNYCIENGIITFKQFSNYKENATRAEMIGIMAAALPDNAWKIINNVEKLPDVFVGTPYSEDIFRMYNAGVIGGSDTYGAFQPHAYITRAEVSAIVSRMADDSLRLKLSLTPTGEKNNPVIPEPKKYYDEFTGKYFYHTVGNGLLAYFDEETNKWGYIDTKGKIVIPAKYKEVEPFENGLAHVMEKQGRKEIHHFIDTKGNIVYSNIELTPLEYDDGYRPFTKDGYQRVMVGEKCALFRNNKPITGFVYDGIGYLNFTCRTFFSVSNGDGRGLIDVTGKEIIPCKYEGVYYSENNKDYFWAKTLNGKGYDVYTSDGKFVKYIEAEENIYISTNGLIGVRKNGKFGLSNLSSGEILEPIYNKCVLLGDYAVLGTGTSAALVGVNGIIYDFGEVGIAGVIGDVAMIFTSETEMMFADINGAFTEKIYVENNGTCELRAVTDEAIYFSDGGNGHLYDRKLGKIVEHTGNIFKGVGTVKWENGVIVSYETGVAYYFKSIVDKSKEVYETKDNKYVFTYYYKDGFEPGFRISQQYSTAEEAIAASDAYRGVGKEEYFVTRENGYPIACFGYQHGEFTTVIRYYKKGVCYDEIVYLGEDCFACRFGEVWYLVQP